MASHSRITVKRRVTSLYRSGRIWDYDIDELAALLECSPRTIRTYINNLKKDLLAEVTPDMIPLFTRAGRMLMILEEPMRGGCLGSVNPYTHEREPDCVFLEMCRFLVKRDCYMACERALRSELE